MKPLFLSAVLCCSLLFSCSTADEDVNLYSSAETETISDVVSYSKIETDILNLVNDYRLKNNLATLQTLNIISTVADEHTSYMIETGDISHAHFADRASKLMKNAGAKEVSENVAYGFSTAESALKGWLNSDEHRKIIENPNFTHFGISSESNDEGRNYFTQIFIKK
ncbi:CAP domain-containing protein [uncultured Lutibacter sp.]|uniref:CAP domain-containing protein n=1 Tax=uncultured Lutibacter sp. TaxID=437739 RepID=UPI00262C8F38|nr:CAP domain-containing protein [uncultured Lutibacter sp.]